MLVAVGLIRSSSSPADRELLAKLEEVVEDLAGFVALGGIDEVAVVSTGFRLEVYAATRCPVAALLALRGALAARAGRELPLFALQGEKAFRHLVRVASGLDSPVLGESRILAQVKEAFERAADAGATGIELTSTLDRVLLIAWRVRNETDLGRSAVSWGHAVAALADKVLGPMDGWRVALLGAGEMARVSGEHLRERGGEVVVLDRTLAKAEALARELDGEARPLEALEPELLRADVVVCAAPGAPEAFGPARMARLSRLRRRRMVLVDLAVPSAIPAATGDVADVYLCDLDDLDRVMRATMDDRAAEVADAERIMDEEVARWARGDAEPSPGALAENSL